MTAATLALVAFAVIVLVPFLKYPSNPPAVGADETIGYRTRIYFVMLLLSVVAAFAALRVGRDAVKRLGAWNGVLVAVGSYIVLVAISQVLMPSLDEIPQGLQREHHLALPHRHARHPRRALRHARPRLRRPRRALDHAGDARRSRYVSNIQPFRRRAALLTRSISPPTSATTPDSRISSGVPR